MEFKDVSSLIFTVVAVLFFKLLSGKKKKPEQNSYREEHIVPPPHKKIEKPHFKKKEHKAPPANKAPLSSSQQRYATQISNTQAYSLVKEKKVKKGRLLFQDQRGLKKAFIMQEILKKPYE